VQDLNAVYKKESALFSHDFDTAGFQWIDGGDWQQSVITFMRQGEKNEDRIVIICNFTPETRFGYRVGVPAAGLWKEILNSDAKAYGGSGHGNFGGKQAEPVKAHGFLQSLSLTLPPLGILFLKREAENQEELFLKANSLDEENVSNENKSGSRMIRIDDSQNSL
jgi:1,4-alpha-glucan branching enzyme